MGQIGAFEEANLSQDDDDRAIIIMKLIFYLSLSVYRAIPIQNTHTNNDLRHKYKCSMARLWETIIKFD